MSIIENAIPPIANNFRTKEQNYNNMRMIIIIDDVFFKTALRNKGKIKLALRRAAKLHPDMVRYDKKNGSSRLILVEEAN